MNKIHWYPGHMKKASNEMLESLKKVDIIVELVDARAPNKSANPFFKKLIINKPTIRVLMKADLADKNKIKLRENDVLLSINDKNTLNNLVKKIELIYKTKKDKSIVRGIKPLPPKVMIVGIPNVGKSSLINALINRRITKVENKPGLTKNSRWINVKDKFYLLDTPGILPSNYDESNYVLALIGAIKIDILPIYELSEFAYNFIIKSYKDLYLTRYKQIKKTSNESFAYIEEIRGIKNDKSATYDLARSLFLKDIRDGKLGKLYFE